MKCKKNTVTVQFLFYVTLSLCSLVLYVSLYLLESYIFSFSFEDKERNGIPHTGTFCPSLNHLNPTTPPSADHHECLSPATLQQHPTLLLHQQPSIPPNQRCGCLLSNLYHFGSHVQSHRLHCSPEVLPADTEPITLFLPDLPGRAGDY